MFGRRTVVGGVSVCVGEEVPLMEQPFGDLAMLLLGLTDTVVHRAVEFLYLASGLFKFKKSSGVFFIQKKAVEFL